MKELCDLTFRVFPPEDSGEEDILIHFNAIEESDNVPSFSISIRKGSSEFIPVEEETILLSALTLLAVELEKWFKTIRREAMMRSLKTGRRLN